MISSQGEIGMEKELIQLDAVASETFDCNQVEKIIQTTLHMKLPEYRCKHGGKSPAKMFISSALRSKIDVWMKWNGYPQAHSTGEETMYGIPVSVFLSDELEIYLSDEER